MSLPHDLSTTNPYDELDRLAHEAHAHILRHDPGANPVIARVALDLMLPALRDLVSELEYERDDARDELKAQQATMEEARIHLMDVERFGWTDKYNEVAKLLYAY